MQQGMVEQTTLLLEDRKRLTINGVESVNGFSESNINLTIKGENFRATGSNLKIVSFNKSNGNFVAEGEFDELKYCGKKTPLLKKIFK